MSMKEKLIDEIILLFRREDIKYEIKKILRPILDVILQDLYPYIYLSILFVLISFLLTLGIFIILLQNYNK